MGTRGRSLRARGMVAATFISLVASACAGGGSTPEQAQERAPLPLDQQVLTIAYGPDAYGSRADRIGKWPLNTLVTETLINMNTRFQPEPMLAERWEHNDATNTFRFFLRRGVKFHDGQEFTARDVKFTVDQATKADPQNYQQIGPDSVVIVDPYTVDITPVRRNNRLIEQIVHPGFAINREDSDPRRPVGTGPFRFVEYVKDDRFVMERFAEYWNPSQAAKAQRITFRFIPDMQVRILGLRSGEFDMIGEVVPDVTKEIEGTPGFEVVRSGPGGISRAEFNIAGMAPYDLGKDPVIREAFMLATDRERLVQTVYQGNADSKPLSADLFGTHSSKVKGVAHDPERAEQLLDRAGWTMDSSGYRTKDGRRLSLSYLANFATPDANLIGEVLQEQLRRVGIELKVDPAGADAATAQAKSREGQYDLLHNGGSQNEANPCFLFDLNHSTPAIGGRAQNRQGAPGGKVDEAILGCRSSRGLDEVRGHAAEAAHLLVDVEHILLMVGNTFRIWAMKDNVDGLIGHPALGRANWDGVYRVG